MRIAFDATALPPNRAGAGNYIFNLIAFLERRDCENEYFIFISPEFIPEFGVCKPNFVFLPVQHTSTPRRLLWEQFELPRQLLRLRVDVLHSPHYTMPCFKAWKSVVTFHDMTFYLYPELHEPNRLRLFRAFMRMSAKRADRLISDSESTKRDMAAILKIAPERITSIPLGASEAFRPLPVERTAQICEKHGLQPGRYLYNVGVLEPRKNLPVLLQAFTQMKDDFPALPLIIAGKKGWMYDAIFQQISALHLEERVRFLGHLPEEELVGLYNGARVFVYPSRYEGFGLPVLEAMQCGTAVITTNVSSLPEVAGDAALLADPDDVNGFAEALRLLLTDDILRAELVQRGLRQSQKFGWHRCAAETSQVYQSLL